MKQAKPMRENMLLALLVVLGAQTMIVELAIPRLIAPLFGNTLFSWTAIIAVVLSALAAGYQFGGRLSRDSNPRRWVVRLSLASSAWILMIAIASEWILQRLDWAGLMLGPLLASALLAALPAAIAAAVVPLAVHLIGGESGSASGRCFAWSTLGSIVGVLATGYLLLPQLGIFGSLLVGPTLVISVLLWARAWTAGLAGLAIIAATFAVSSGEEPVGLLLDKSNGYHRLRIIEGAAGIRYMKLDSTTEGAVMGDSPVPVLGYQRSIGAIVEATGAPHKVLFLGGGSFSMPRYVKHLHPAASVTTVEIDRDVIDAARRYLGLTDSIDVRHGDARRVLIDSEGGFDLVVNDAFHGVRKIPFHLVTREFNALVRERLSARGVYAVNVIGHPAQSRLVKSMIRTLRDSFPHLALYFLDGNQATNIWMLAGMRPLTVGMAPADDDSDELLLTDDNAPIEYLIAAELLNPVR